MNTYIESKQFHITPKASKTITLLNGTLKSHINCYIPNFVTIDDKNLLYHTAKICHLEIPYSFYIINYTNNKLTINNVTITVPVGNYNATTLLVKLNDLFSEYGLTNFVLTFDATIGKYTLTANDFFTISPSSISNVLGLDDFVYNSIFNMTTNKYVLEYPYLVNTSGSKNIYIRTNIITSNLNVINSDPNIIKSIPVDVAPYGIIQYSNNQGIETLVKNRQMNNLEIEMLDDNGNYINFNNVEWAICLEIKSVYQLQLIPTTIF